MWLGLRVGGRLALLYIHQMNRVNSRNDLGHNDSTRCGYYYYYYYYTLGRYIPEGFEKKMKKKTNK